MGFVFAPDAKRRPEADASDGEQQPTHVQQNVTDGRLTSSRADEQQGEGANGGERDEAERQNSAEERKTGSRKQTQKPDSH